MVSGRGGLRLGVLAAILGVPGAAQPRLNDSNLHGWYVYSGDHPLTDRWGIHLEGQWRRHDVGLRPQQLLLRPAVNYRLSGKVGLSAGYAFVSTHRYGDYPVARAFPEHRLHQQLMVRHGPPKLEFQHRFRLEQRWIEQRFSSDRWRYQNRIRYMIRAVAPLRRDWYLAVSDEVFVNLPPAHEPGATIRTGPLRA